MAEVDPDQDRIIKQVLAEEEREKQLRKAQKANDFAKIEALKKGKTLQEVEEEEGGPIKESLVAIAHAKRSSKRKKGADDTDLVEDVEGIEEELQVEENEEGGVQFEPFNLKEERQKGYFDEEGTYVEKEDEDDVKDNWLKSDEAKVVSEDVLRKIKEREQAIAAADAAGPLTAPQIARLQYTIAKILNDPEETVTKALRRLGNLVGTTQRKPLTKRSKESSAAADEAAAAKGDQKDPEARAKFDTLTEAAGQLMDAGELDIYSQNKSYLQRAAAFYIDDEEEGDEGDRPGAKLLAGGVSKAVYENDADEDMFADDGDDDKDNKKEEEGKGVQHVPNSGVVDNNNKAAVVEEDTTDYGSWPVKELRNYLKEHGVDTSGIIEKSDLVARVKQTAAASKQKGKNDQAAYHVPPGYVYDPSSQMWYSEESQMYFDTKSGGFCSAADGKWYSYDGESGSWVAWPGA